MKSDGANQTPFSLLANKSAGVKDDGGGTGDCPNGLRMPSSGETISRMRDHHRGTVLGIGIDAVCTRHAGEEVGQCHVALALAGAVADRTREIGRGIGADRGLDQDEVAADVLERDRGDVGVCELRPRCVRNGLGNLLCHVFTPSFGVKCRCM